MDYFFLLFASATAQGQRQAGGVAALAAAAGAGVGVDTGGRRRPNDERLAGAAGQLRLPDGLRPHRVLPQRRRRRTHRVHAPFFYY